MPGERAVVLKQTGLGWLTLLAASGTLICCALPIILVSIGLGAAVAAVTSSVPLLITVAQHKLWAFVVSGTFLIITGWLIHRPVQTCPADPELARACNRAQDWNRRIYWSSIAIWSIGFCAAYLSLPLRIWLER